MAPPATAGWRAGFVRRRLAANGSSWHLPVTFWYPAHLPESRLRVGLYDLSVAPSAEPAEGRFPLIAISHGSGGSDVNHHDWAEAFARAGFVVVAPRHVGDAHVGMDARERILDRPRQLRQAIDAALSDPLVGPHVASERLGLLGFSAGGYTCLMALGARPAFSRWRDHCRENPHADIVCPANLVPAMPEMKKGEWNDVLVPEAGAAVLCAPFAMIFDKPGLAGVRTPMRLYRAENDSVTLNSANADFLADQLPIAPERVTVPGEHYVFIAPIENELAERYPLYYRDAAGVDRRGIHRRLGGEMVDFFRAVLPGRK